MRLKVTEIGNGIKRVEVEKTCWCEPTPCVHTVDAAVREMVRKERNNSRLYGCCQYGRNVSNMCGCTDMGDTRTLVGMSRPMREPDGIDVHVDRPRRENFYSHWEWDEAMKKYRRLERSARECDWECREPMRGTTKCPNLICHIEEIW